MNKNMIDVKSMAKEIEYIFDVCGYNLSEFKVDVLTGVLDIKAKEKTADGGTSSGQKRKCK